MPVLQNSQKSHVQLGQNQAPAQQLKKPIKLSHLMYNPVDQLSKEKEAQAKAKEEHEAKLLESFRDAGEAPADTADDLKETLEKMQAKINSAQRKMDQFKSNAGKRVATGFEDEKPAAAETTPALAAPTKIPGISQPPAETIKPT